jgi:hypothetical protein
MSQGPADTTRETALLMAALSTIMVNAAIAAAAGAPHAGITRNINSARSRPIFANAAAAHWCGLYGLTT